MSEYGFPVKCEKCGEYVLRTNLGLCEKCFKEEYTLKGEYPGYNYGGKKDGFQ